MSSGRMGDKTGVSEHSICDLHCTENAENIQTSHPSGACGKLLCSGLFPPPRTCRPPVLASPHAPLAISALSGLLGTWALSGGWEEGCFASGGLCSREQPRPWLRSPQSPGQSLYHADGRGQETHQGPTCAPSLQILAWGHLPWCRIMPRGCFTHINSQGDFCEATFAKIHSHGYMGISVSLGEKEEFTHKNNVVFSPR